MNPCLVGRVAGPPLWSLSLPRRVHPAIRLEPAEGVDDALFDGELRFPAGRLDFFGVEEDEGVVADPAPITVAEAQFRLEAQRPADDANGIAHLHVPGRAEVVDLGAVRCLGRR